MFGMLFKLFYTSSITPITDKRGIFMDPKLKTITGVILPPKDGNGFSGKKPLVGAIFLPKWGGNLDFRAAREDEADRLKLLYEKAWGSGIRISADQLRASMRNFPDGQIVGCEKGSDTPVSMINIMLALFDPKKGFEPGYERVTGGRTFATTVPPDVLFAEVERRGNGNSLPVAFCISIAVPPEYGKGGYAFETLNYAIMFSNVNRLIPAPYSAPRGFARAREKNPSLDIMDYLHMTRPFGHLFPAYLAKIGAICNRLAPAFGGRTILDKELFARYQNRPVDSLRAPREETAFGLFRKIDGGIYEWKYGRPLTIEDFCILTGRQLLDPVIGMHVGNGARFIRDGEGRIAAVFADSRPEDPAALGYNIVLSYGYHPLLGHRFAPVEGAERG